MRAARWAHQASGADLRIVRQRRAAGFIGRVRSAVTDQITINGHLHMVNSVQSPDALDEQEITIWPRLRENAAQDETIEALAPYGAGALAKPSNGHSTNFRSGRSMKLDLIEAL